MPSCPLCSKDFAITPAEDAGRQKVEFTFGETNITPPPPSHCPTCRMILRTCHRNERTMYRRPDSRTGIPIVSLLAESPPWGDPYTVWDQEDWKSDQLDPMQYGREFDFSRPFFEQLSELHKVVPRMNLTQVSNQNSPYTTGTGFCKNCYLINSSENCEDCYHGKLLQTCKDSMDCSYLYNSDLCYGCFSVHNAYNCQFLLFSQNCQDCHYSSNLNSCKNCLLCTNLHRKEYCIENKQVTKEEFKEALTKIRGSYSEQQKTYQKLLQMRADSPQKFTNIVNSDDCTGDFLENCKSCHDCYDLTDSEDCQFAQVGIDVTDVVDCSNMYLKIERCYQVLGTIEVYNSAYSIYLFFCHDMLYCDYCLNSSNCFGCCGLDRKEYCIFNKQHSKDEYEALVPKIIEKMQEEGSWGQFFPRQYAPYGYNESLAYEYLPLTKEQATSRGFLWRDDIDQTPQVEKMIPGNRLPDKIEDIPDDILKWAITCESTGRPFQIIAQELAYYRSHGIPIPHDHPDERHRKRMTLRNDRKLYSRECGDCSTTLQSPYSPDRSDRILCEDCFLKTVY